jgi:hypothetical protein
MWFGGEATGLYDSEATGGPHICRGAAGLVSAALRASMEGSTVAA